VLAAEQRTIDLYHRQGLIPKRLDAAAVLDASFNEAARRGAASATQ
jgi:sulfonate transport system substrate-binding protein